MEKMLKYISDNLSWKVISFSAMIVLGAVLVSSCEEEDGIPLESPSGEAAVHYIRVPAPESGDSLIVKGNLGTTLAIVGENLGGTREVWFNDRPAVISPSWVTNRTVFVSVPNLAPLNVTDKLYLINGAGDTLAHDFEVTIPAPEVLSARNEWPQAGEALIINGDFFFDVEGEVPVVVDFTGGVQSTAEVVNQNQLSVPIPTGAQEGPVTVTTNFGTTESPFHIWDSRNIILNFDDPAKSGNGFRTGLNENSNNPINGNYCVVRWDGLDAYERNEGSNGGASPLMMEYKGWRANLVDPSIGPGNFYDGLYSDYALKFEAQVVTWSSGYLHLCPSAFNHGNEDGGQGGSNQEVWSNNANRRAYWGPWEETGETFTTDGSWITVVVPLTEFIYHRGDDGEMEEAAIKFDENAFGSMSTWMIGSAESDPATPFEFYFDNMRVVPIE